MQATSTRTERTGRALQRDFAELFVNRRLLKPPLPKFSFPFHYYFFALLKQISGALSGWLMKNQNRKQKHNPRITI